MGVYPAGSKGAVDRELSHLDPQHRIVELEREIAALRTQRARLIRALAIEQAADGFAMDLIGRGIRAPRGTRFTADGWLDG